MSEMESFTGALQARLRPLREQLAAHSLYASLQTMEDLRCFMEAHVYAVWDFMSLLKTLQRGLTCVEVPWMPSADAEARRLINEIVLGEESDVYEGRAASHLEVYLEAMREAGASTEGMDGLLAALGRGMTVEDALRAASAPGAVRVPASAQAFLLETFALLKQQQLHIVAAAFTFGREDLIPEMFRGFVRDLDARLAGRLRRFVWYLERHIEVDGEEHGPMALRMVAGLCGSDPVRWEQAAVAAEGALRARIALWDGILERVEGARASVMAAADRA